MIWNPERAIINEKFELVEGRLGACYSHVEESVIRITIKTFIHSPLEMVEGRVSVPVKRLEELGNVVEFILLAPDTVFLTSQYRRGRHWYCST